MSKDIATIIDILAKPNEIIFYEVRYQCLAKITNQPRTIRGFTCTSCFFQNKANAIDKAYELYCEYVEQVNRDHPQNVTKAEYSKTGYYCIAGEGGSYYWADLRIEVNFNRFNLDTDGICSATGFLVA